VPATDDTSDDGEQLDVVCLGNALVDVLAYSTDDDLARLQLNKGSMALVDLPRAAQIYEGMQNTIEVSGGSAANTTAGVAALGGRAGYIGKVAADELGEIFVHDMSVLGVEFGFHVQDSPARKLRTAPVAVGAASSSDEPDAAPDDATGRSLVLVTPDGERTMATHLGVASTLAPEDIDHDLVARGEIVYVEGYLWDTDAAKDAVRLAMSIAHSSDGLVALSLSDPFCVDRHRKELLALLDGDVDLLFCNEDELKLLFATEDLAHGLDALSETGLLAAVTLGARGSVVVMSDGTVEVGAEPVEAVVDTTGAGDLYAAGFLYGMTHGQDPVSAARLGGACAAEVISHLGARPQSDISTLVNTPHLRLL
jgi:sugar/nucleoside kinase (ribokinase family)